MTKEETLRDYDERITALKAIGHHAAAAAVEQARQQYLRGYRDAEARYAPLVAAAKAIEESVEAAYPGQGFAGYAVRLPSNSTQMRRLRDALQNLEEAHNG